MKVPCLGKKEKGITDTKKIENRNKKDVSEANEGDKINEKAALLMKMIRMQTLKLPFLNYHS